MFAPEFRDSKNMHLRNFYVIVPPLVSLTSKKLRDVTVSIATVAVMCDAHDGSLILIITLIFGAPCQPFQYRFEVYEKSEKLCVLGTLRRLSLCNVVLAVFDLD